jgi:hypothetical protein
MSSIVRILTAGTALFLAAPAFAADSIENGAIVVNGQLNLGPVFSDLNAVIDTVGGDVSAQSAAAGNTVTIFTNADTSVSNNQGQGGDVGSWLGAKVSGVGGDVSLTGTAVCNNAEVSTDPRITKVDNVQKCWAKDPYATVGADVQQVKGLVGITATAVSNQVEIDSNAARFPVNNWQETHSGSFATVNAKVSNVGGAGISSTAVGNTAQILHIGH